MSLSRIQGQKHAITRLKQLLVSRNLPPALLFSGPSGVGKALAAREFAKALNCTSPKPDGDCCDTLGDINRGHLSPKNVLGDACGSCVQADKGIDMDLKLVNSAYQSGLTGEEVEKQTRIKIDTIRYLVKDLEMRSMAGRWKTAIVEDAHRMQAEAQNALLKALEEPPPHTLWILATDQRDQLLPTVRSRCHALPFRTLPPAVIHEILLKHAVSNDEAKQLIPLCEGSPGRALELSKRNLPDPISWLKDPLAPFRLAEQLPRELHLARPLAEDHLRRMAWHLRLHAPSETSPRTPGGIYPPSAAGKDVPPSPAAAVPRNVVGAPSETPTARIRKTYQELEFLGRALKSNADPRLVVEMGALALQGSGIG